MHVVVSQYYTGFDVLRVANSLISLKCLIAVNDETRQANCKPIAESKIPAPKARVSIIFM